MGKVKGVCVYREQGRRIGTSKTQRERPSETCTENGGSIGMGSKKGASCKEGLKSS